MEESRTAIAVDFTPQSLTVSILREGQQYSGRAFMYIFASPAAEAPHEEVPCARPGHDAAQDALRYHPRWRVVHRSKGDRHLRRARSFSIRKPLRELRTD